MPDSPAKTFAQLSELAESVNTPEDLVAFIEDLANNARNTPETWANLALPMYLDSMGAWGNAMLVQGLRKAGSPPTAPSWSTFAELILAPKVYE